MALKQENRPLAIKTALDDDVLALRSFSIQEELGRMYQIEAELVSENGEIPLDKVVGQNATIRLEIADKKTRYFNGEVCRLVQVAHKRKDSPAAYRATIVPWLWFLTRTAECYIFQDMTVPEILEDVFKTWGFSDYDIKGLSGTYPKREYCVQYRETDFNFVSRLMEQEGIYYYFNHTNGKNILMLADSISAHNPFDGYADVIFHEVEAGGASREVVTDWTMEKEVQPIVYVLRDFDFKKPANDLLGVASVTREYGAANFEMFDYPGEYVEQSEGDRLADVRLKEIQAQYEVLEGQGNVRGLSTGCTFKLKKHPRPDQNREYLITSVSLSADGGPFDSSAGGGDGQHFSCSFACIDKTYQFRTPRLTPKPIIQGPQTAIVVGPAGEEIYTDKYARVKVLFHWDRYSKADEKSSCWVRVSQGVGGKGWGQISNPRIGQEVIIEFLEGDPDRPIITGRVYNGEAMPPYALPANQTMSTIKSNSSKGGAGFNEIRLEDKKGDEQIFMHGEKDLDIRIKNNTCETIGNDRHLVVGKDQVEHVKNNRSETVDADHMEKIGKDRHLNVAGKEAKEVTKSQSLTVKGDVIEVFKANHSEQTTGDYYLKAKNIVIEAETNITINVGKSFIAIEASGIKIKTPGDIVMEASKKIEQKADLTFKAEGGLKADFKAGLVATLDGGASVTVKAAVGKVTADGDLTIKGATVKIN